MENKDLTILGKELRLIFQKRWETPQDDNISWQENLRTKFKYWNESIYKMYVKLPKWLDEFKGQV